MHSLGTVALWNEELLIKELAGCELTSFSLKLGSMSLVNVHGSFSAALQVQVKSMLSRLSGKFSRGRD